MINCFSLLLRKISIVWVIFLRIIKLFELEFISVNNELIQIIKTNLISQQKITWNHRIWLKWRCNESKTVKWQSIRLTNSELESTVHRSHTFHSSEWFLSHCLFSHTATFGSDRDEKVPGKCRSNSRFYCHESF